MRLHTICIPEEVCVFPKNSDQQRPLGKCLSALLLKVCQRALGFDTLIMREDAANMLAITTRQIDRLSSAEKIPVYKTIHGTRFRMGDIIAYGQMRGKVNCDLELKKYNPWSKRMTDLDKVLGQLMNEDLSHAPMDLDE